jgi:hypothetical protein
MRNWWLLSIPLVIVLLIGVGMPFLTIAKWAGGKKLEVQVTVIDTDAMEPVRGAEVTMFAGQESPIEGGIEFRKPAVFLPNPESTETETRVTDSNGFCRFTYRFFAYGSEGPFDHSGAVRTSGTWLRVSAPDRPYTLVPLDRQSVRARDLNDETPL